MIIDLNNHKIKYGEILMAFQTAIILKSMAVNIKVCIFLPKNVEGNIYNRMIKNDIIMHRAFNDVVSLANLILNQAKIDHLIIQDNIEEQLFLTENIDNLMFGIQNARLHKVLSIEECKNVAFNFFVLNQELLSLLVAYKSYYLQQRDTWWLIGNLLKTINSENKRTAKNRYIATNYRYNLSRPDKNSDALKLIRNARDLWDKFNIKTLVVTCEYGKKDLHKKMVNPEEYVFFAQPGNYIEESFALVEAEFLYQIQGGGINVWHVLSSNLPYLLKFSPGHLIPFKREALFSFSNPEIQEYLITGEVDDTIFKEKAEDMLCKILCC
jgi:hypothetical protein